MKLFHHFALFITCISTLLQSVMATHYRAGFRFPGVGPYDCNVDEVSYLSIAQGIAYAFTKAIAEGVFINNANKLFDEYADFDVSSRNDNNVVRGQVMQEFKNSNLLWAYFNDFIVDGHPRQGGHNAELVRQNHQSQGSGTRKLVDYEEFKSIMEDNSHRSLGTCSECCNVWHCIDMATTNCREGHGSGCDCSDFCNLRRLKSNEIEQGSKNLRGLQSNQNPTTLQTATCPLNAITMSNIFTELINNYFNGNCNCIEKKDYIMHLCDTKYKVTVDYETGQQISINKIIT